MIGCQGQLEKLNFLWAAMHLRIYSTHSIDGGMEGWMDRWMPTDILPPQTRQLFCNRLDQHRAVLALNLQRAWSRARVYASSPSRQRSRAPIQPITKQRRIDRSRVMEMCNVRVHRCQGGLWEIARLEWMSPIKLGPCVFISNRLHLFPCA